MMSLYDVEQEENKIKNIVNRDTLLPTKIIGKNIKISKIENPEDILKHFKYFNTKVNGWVKKINRHHRFHAFISRDRNYINIHCDYMEGKKHRATIEFVPEEKHKIDNFINHELTMLGYHPINKYPKCKVETLPANKMKEAFAKLKESRRKKEIDTNKELVKLLYDDVFLTGLSESELKILNDLPKNEVQEVQDGNRKN
jgi:hypothetical protein